MTYRSFLHHSVEHDNAPAFLLPYHLPKVTTGIRQRALQTQNPQSICHVTRKHTAVLARCWWLVDDSALRQSGGGGWEGGPGTGTRLSLLVVSNRYSIF